MKRYMLEFSEPKYDAVISYKIVSLVDTADGNLPIKFVRIVPADNQKAWLIEPLRQQRDRMNEDHDLYTEELTSYANG